MDVSFIQDIGKNGTAHGKYNICTNVSNFGIMILFLVVFGGEYIKFRACQCQSIEASIWHTKNILWVFTNYVQI